MIECAQQHHTKIYIEFVIDCVLAYLLFLISTLLFAGFDQLSHLLMDRHDANAIIGSARSDRVMWQLVATLSVTGLTSYSVYRLRCPASAKEKRIAWDAWSDGKTWRWLAIGVVGVVLINIMLTTVVKQLGIAIDPSNSALIHQAIHQSPIFLTLFVVILAPIYEELLFRRVLFGRFLRAQKTVLGVLLSSFLFALMHEIPGHSINGGWALLSLWLIYGAMGCILAVVYQRTQALWASVVVHGCNNLLALLLLLYG